MNETAGRSARQFHTFSLQMVTFLLNYTIRIKYRDIIRFFNKNIKNVFIAARHAAPPSAVKIALNNIFSGESRLRRILRRNKTIPSFY